MSSHNRKTAIRERMKTTGENYTTARRAVTEGESFEPFLSQYVRSNAPEVLEALRRRVSLGRYVTRARRELAMECNGQSDFFVSSRAEVPEMTAIAGEKPTDGGQWRKAASGKGWAPAKGNPIKERWDALAKVPVLRVPGMPEAIMALPYIWNVRPFVHDGYAWVGLADDPSGKVREPLRDDEAFGPQWTSIKGSDYLKAVEDYNESVAGTTRPHATEEQVAEGKALFEMLVAQEAEREAQWRQSMAEVMSSHRRENPMATRSRFVRSTDPEVVEAVRKAWEGWGKAHKGMVKFAQQHSGSPEYVTRNQGPSLHLLGLPVEPPSGAWTRDRKTKTFRPYKETGLYRRMINLSYRAAPIPGADEAQYDDQMQMMMFAPQVFLVDGVAWGSLGAEPGEGSGFGPQWESTSPEQMEAAHEQWQAEKEALKNDLTKEALAEFVLTSSPA